MVYRLLFTHANSPFIQTLEIRRKIAKAVLIFKLKFNFAHLPNSPLTPPVWSHYMITITSPQ